MLDTLYARSVKPSTVIGSDKLKRAVVYRALGLLAESYGQAYRDERKELGERFAACMDVFKAVAATDDDEDGAVEPHERHTRGGVLQRA